MSQLNPPTFPTNTNVAPHRGGIVLALGILAIVVCFICGIVAWVMGSKDLKEMQAGRMDPSGMSLTKAGKICGIIGVALWSIFIVFYVAIVVLAIGAAVAGAAASGARP